MTRQADSIELPERRGRRRRNAEPEPTNVALEAAREPQRQAGRVNGPETSGAVQKDPSPSAEPDDARRLERVRRKAYELYLGRGGAPGDAIDDWLEAERQIDDERSR